MKKTGNLLAIIYHMSYINLRRTENLYSVKTKTEKLFYKFSVSYVHKNNQGPKIYKHIIPEEFLILHEEEDGCSSVFNILSKL